MGQGSVVWERLIEAAARAPWWVTATAGLGAAAVLHLAPRVLVLLGEENDLPWRNLAALWWFPLVLCGFFAGISFLRQRTRRMRRSRREGGVPRCTDFGDELTAGSKREQGRQSAPLRKAK
jgi:hypothetical protein